MRAFVDGDIIIYITERGPVDIGRIPPGKRKVGLERLRWDGDKIVDLMDLSEIWVSYNGHGFILHAIEVPGSQKIKMGYADRDRLIFENGEIRLRTVREYEADLKQQEAKIARARARKQLERAAGDVHEQLSDAYRLIYLLILALIGKDKAAKEALEDLLEGVSGNTAAKLKKGVKVKMKERSKVFAKFS